MKMSVLASLALGITLALSMAAYATQGDPTPVHSHRAIHHKTISSHVTALAPTIPSATPWLREPEPYEMEGLSRNPDDCAKYGCIGNN
jgi:hypothetical protein